MSERLQHGRKASLVGLATNGVLAVVKLAAGILGHSYALIADAIESTADIFSSLIVWRGMVIAHRPADEDHPYGHGRAETIAAAVVSIMLLVAAALILYQSIREIIEPHAAPAPFTLFVLLGVVLIKEGLFRFVGAIGAAIESDAVRTDAWHHRSDAITSAAAALGIGLSLVGGPGFSTADEWAAIFASAIIAFNGWRLLRSPLKELMETEPVEDVTGAARRVALGVTGVRGVEKCFARKLGYTFLMDMHVEVDGTLSVTEAHRIAHAVKGAIRQALPRVNDVTVHIEPFGEA